MNLTLRRPVMALIVVILLLGTMTFALSVVRLISSAALFLI